MTTHICSVYARHSHAYTVYSYLNDHAHNRLVSAVLTVFLSVYTPLL